MTQCKPSGEVSKGQTLWTCTCWPLTWMRSRVSNENCKGARRTYCLLSQCDVGERMRKASKIKGNLLDLRVAISCLMERMKKEPTLETIAMPMIGGVNLPRIEVPMFDGTILNCWLLWEQFQATVHDKPHLGDVDTDDRELWRSHECLKDCYDHPRVTHHQHVQSILQAFIMKEHQWQKAAEDGWRL